MDKRILQDFLIEHRFKFLYVLLLYIAISILFTYPLILNLTEAIPGWEGDGFLYLWNIYSFWDRVFKFQNPFFTVNVFYPLGANLALHTYGVLPSLFGIFFLNNLVLYMNILVILSLAISAFACFLLVKDLTRDLTISVISGLIYGFSPIMVSYILSQHYYFAMAAPYLPLGLLMLFKFFETARTKYLAFIILFFWLSFFTDYYMTILYILILTTVSLIFLILYYFNDKNKFPEIFRYLRIFNCILIFISTVALPLILFFVLVFPMDEFKDKAFSSNNWYPFYCSANLANFIIPSDVNPILKKISESMRSSLGLDRNYDTPSYFLGWGLLILAMISFIRNFKNRYVLSVGVFGVVIFLLSVGPFIRFGKTELISQKLTAFYWFSKFPFLGLIDCPQRFPVAIQLSIAVLIGLLICSIVIRRYKVIVIALTLFLFIFEFLSWNIDISNVQIPLIYRQLGTEKDNYTVLEIPSGISESKGGFGNDGFIRYLHTKQLFWQTVHKKPRVGGYLSRVPEGTFNYFKTKSIISDLFNMVTSQYVVIKEDYSDQEVKEFLRTFNLGYIVLSPNPRREEFSVVIEKLLKNHISDKRDYEGFILYKLKQN